MKKTFIFLVLVALSFFQEVQAGLASGGMIEAIGGSDHVRVNRSGKPMFLKKGENLQIGDELVTDQKTAVDVRLEDRSLIRIGINSSYKMTEDSKSKQIFHRLLSGIVRILVPENKDGGKKEIKFRMGTPEGTIGVRGTEFVVQRSEANGQTVLRGLSGEVSFAAEDTDFAAAEKFVGVKKGFLSRVKKGESMPSTPETYDVGSYVKELDDGTGAFAPLSKRVGGAQLSRNDSAQQPIHAASSGASAMPKAAARPLALNSNNTAVKDDKKPEENKEEKEKIDPNKELMDSIVLGKVDRAKNALDKLKANPRHQFEDAGGNTPLHAAVATDSLGVDKKLEMMFILVDKGAIVNAKNKRGQTPLMMAAIEENIDPKVAQYLVEQGADPDLKDKDGKTFKQYATELNREKMITFIKDLEAKEKNQ